MTADAVNMSSFFIAAGFNQVQTLTHPNNTRQDLKSAIETLTAREDCTDLTLYISTHGFTDYLSLGTSFIFNDQLTEIPDDNDGAEYKAILDACKAGSFMDDLVQQLDTVTAITSTSATQSAFGDIDSSGDDPNPEDVGGEFTSGLFEDLTLIMSDRAQREAVPLFSKMYGVRFMSMLYHFAYESAVAKDLAAKLGWSTPMHMGSYNDGNGQPIKLPPAGSTEFTLVGKQDVNVRLTRDLGDNARFIGLVLSVMLVQLQWASMATPESPPQTPDPATVTITVTSPASSAFVLVTGTLAFDGSFTAGGVGFVGEIPNVSVELIGLFSSDQPFMGMYEMGAMGTLIPDSVLYEIEADAPDRSVGP